MGFVADTAAAAAAAAAGVVVVDVEQQRLRLFLPGLGLARMEGCPKNLASGDLEISEQHARNLRLSPLCEGNKSPNQALRS
jgi:hypothetical protein